MMINNIGRVTPPPPVGQNPSILEEGRIRHQLINLSSLTKNLKIGGLRQIESCDSIMLMMDVMEVTS